MWQLFALNVKRDNKKLLLITEADGNFHSFAGHKLLYLLKPGQKFVLFRN